MLHFYFYSKFLFSIFERTIIRSQFQGKLKEKHSTTILKFTMIKTKNKKILVDIIACILYFLILLISNSIFLKWIFAYFQNLVDSKDIFFVYQITQQSPFIVSWFKTKLSLQSTVDKSNMTQKCGTKSNSNLIPPTHTHYFEEDTYFVRYLNQQDKKFSTRRLFYCYLDTWTKQKN